jgi:hypothetical protein
MNNHITPKITQAEVGGFYFSCVGFSVVGFGVGVMITILVLILLLISTTVGLSNRLTARAGLVRGHDDDPETEAEILYTPQMIYCQLERKNVVTLY